MFLYATILYFGEEPFGFSVYDEVTHYCFVSAGLHPAPTERIRVCKQTGIVEGTEDLSVQQQVIEELQSPHLQWHNGQTAAA